MKKSRRTISAVLAVFMILALVAMYVRIGLAANREAGSGLATGRRQYAIVPGLSGVKTVAAYNDNYLALKADGTVWTLGITVNEEGVKSVTPGGDLDGDGFPDDVAIDELGVHFAPQQLKGLDRITAVAAGDGFAVALRSDGTVVVAPIEPAKGPVAGGLDRVKAIAAGPDKVLALKTDGTVWTADIAIDEAGVHVAKAVQVPEIGPAQFATFGPGGEVLAVMGDGSVRVADTAAGKTQVSKVDDLQGVRSIAAHADGRDDDCDGIAYAVTADGRVSAMAIKTKGTGAQRVMAGVSSAAGACASGLALKADGTVWTMGFAISEPGMPGAAAQEGGKTIGAGQVSDIIATAVAAGYTWHMAVRPEGSVAVWRAPIHVKQVKGVSNVVAVYASGDAALAQLADGTVADVCNPCTATRKTFVVPHVLETKGIAISGNNYYVLHADGSVTAHKVGGTGAGLATGMVPGGSVVSAAVSANKTHLFALQSDGTVLSIAIDEPGVHVVEGMSGVTGIAAYEGGVVALTAGGKGWDGTIKGAAFRTAPVDGLDGARSTWGWEGQGYWAILGDGTVAPIAIDETGVHVWGDPHVDEKDGIMKVTGGGGGSGGSVLLTAAGTVKVSDFGPSRTTVVTELSDVIDVAANNTYAYAVKADGTLWSWPLR